MMSGVGDRAREALRKLVEPLGLEPLQGGGGTATDPDAPQHFVNGGGLGVQLARGDVSIMGLGTATYVDGAGKVAGFGHPMLNGGDEAIPACIGRVLWIDASAQASHKVGECARALGTLVQDRQTAIVVDERIAAPVIPIDLDIAGVVGAPKLHWHAEVTDDKFLGPGLTATVIESAIEATTSERRDLTWKMTSRVTVAGHGSVDLEDDGVATGGAPDAGDWIRSKLVNTVGDVLNNPWEHARVDGITARFEVKYARDLWRLRGVEVLDPVVDAGSKARLRLHLVPENGPEVTRVVEATMPAELAGKDVDVEIVPGYDRRAGAARAREPRPAAGERAPADDRRARGGRAVPGPFAGDRLPRPRDPAAAALHARRAAPAEQRHRARRVPELVAHGGPARLLRRGSRQGEGQGPERPALNHRSQPFTSSKGRRRAAGPQSRQERRGGTGRAEGRKIFGILRAAGRSLPSERRVSPDFVERRAGTPEHLPTFRPSCDPSRLGGLAALLSPIDGRAR